MPLSHHLPDLATLELLADAVRLGSIGAAAREHGISQQAASQRLRAAEARVGTPLLRRSPRGAEPTEAGAMLTEWAQRLLEVAAEVDLAVASLRRDRSAVLSVAASMTVAEHLLPRWLLALRAQQIAAGGPLTAVRLTALNSTQVVAAVTGGSADVGFVEGPAAPAGLPSRPVAADELVVVVTPGHPWSRRRAALTPQELAAAPLIGREEGSGTRQAFQSALAACGLRPVPAAVELTTSTAIREAVRASGAAAVLSRLAVEGDLSSGRLVTVPVTGLDLTRTLRAVWRDGANPPAGPARDLVVLAATASRRVS